MIVLASTGDLLQVVTAEAVGIDVHASWLDTSALVVTPGRTNTAIPTATTTTVVASPGASTQRLVEGLTIRNTHASLPQTVTIQHSDGAVVATLIEAILLPGETLEYADG